MQFQAIFTRSKQGRQRVTDEVQIGLDSLKNYPRAKDLRFGWLLEQVEGDFRSGVTARMSG